MQETVTIKRTDALNAFKIAKAMNSQDTVTLLKNLMPGVLGQITERIDGFNDICAEAGENPKDYEVHDGMTARQKRHILGDKLHLIAQVLNEGVKIDYSNTNQKKWQPYFKWNGAGFGFSPSDYDCDHTAASVGVRFASEGISDFAGRKFIKEYNEYLTLF